MWRLVHLTGVLAFLLPFVAVKGCSSSEVTTYRGYELIGKDFQEFREFGWYFLLPICIGAAFFGLSFVRRRVGDLLQGFMKSWRLMLSSIAFSVAFIMTFWRFLFDTVTPRVGWFLATISWSLVWIGGFIGVIVHLSRVRAVRLAPSGAPRRRFLLLRIEHWLVAVLAVWYPVWCVGGSSGEQDWTGVAWNLLGLCVFSVPVILILHFADQGLRNNEHWAVVWGAFFSLVLLILGIVSSAWVVTDNEMAWLLFTLPASCFVAIALASAMAAFRQYCIEFWNHRTTKRSIEGMS